MNLKVILTRGLPGSGKTTWAKQTALDNPGKYKIICKDDLREMLDAWEHSSPNEKFVLKIRDLIIEQALRAGKNVIVADTNLSHKHFDHISDFVSRISGRSVLYQP